MIKKIVTYLNLRNDEVFNETDKKTLTVLCIGSILISLYCFIYAFVYYKKAQKNLSGGCVVVTVTFMLTAIYLMYNNIKASKVSSKNK